MTASARPTYPPTEPIPVLETAPPWRDTFVSLGVRNYRLFAVANLVATSVFWMQRVAQDWLVLSLSGDVAAVGVTASLQWAPLLLFGLLAGALVDRLPRRLLLQIGQAAAGTINLALAGLTLSGVVQVWHVYVAAAMLGAVTVIEWPARSVFANDLVDQRRLGNALSLNSSTFQLAAFVGPMVGGALLLAVGVGWTFAVNVAGSGLAILVLAYVRVDEMHRPTPGRRAPGGIREGLRYARSKPAIVWTLVLLAALALFAQNMPVYLAGFANTRFDTGAAGYSLCNAMVALGAFAAAVWSTRRRSVSLRRVVVCTAIYTAVLVVVGWAPSQWSFAIGLVAVGFGWLTLVTSANYLVQVSANPLVRGRVMSIYTLVLFGGQALGGLVVGWAVAHLGPSAAMSAGGAIALAAAIIVGLIALRRPADH